MNHLFNPYESRYARGGIEKRFTYYSPTRLSIFSKIICPNKEISYPNFRKVLKKLSDPKEFQRFDFICHEKFIMQQVIPSSAIEIDHSANARSTHCIEHSEEKQTASQPLPLMGLPITRHTSMCPSCITHRQKLQNMT